MHGIKFKTLSSALSNSIWGGFGMLPHLSQLCLYVHYTSVGDPSINLDTALMPTAHSTVSQHEVKALQLCVKTVRAKHADIVQIICPRLQWTY